MKAIKMSILLTASALLCASCSSFYSSHASHVKRMPIAHKQQPQRLAQQKSTQTRHQSQAQTTQTKGAQFGGGINEYDDGADVDNPYSANRQPVDPNRPHGRTTRAKVPAQTAQKSESPEIANYRNWSTHTPNQNPRCLMTQSTPGTEQHYFFGLNKSVVDQGFIQSVNNQARFLITHPDVKVRIEGNADERGSREYNIALAARRAKAVVAMFKQQGVPARQYTMVSYGAEKPAAKGENEEAYHCNRRVDIIYEVDKNA